jgi:hypothetical protein
MAKYLGIESDEPIGVLVLVDKEESYASERIADDHEPRQSDHSPRNRLPDRQGE